MIDSGFLGGRRRSYKRKEGEMKTESEEHMDLIVSFIKMEWKKMSGQVLGTPPSILGGYCLLGPLLPH